MKKLASTVIQSRLCLSAAALTLLACSAPIARAGDAIPYPDSGSPNPVLYTFTATASGPVTAYFAGSGASYDNELTMLDNGVPTGVVGLDNQSSFLGQSLVLGNVTAGDTLVFVLVNNTLGEDAYSDASLNGSYDTSDIDGHNHVYSTAYTATSPIIDSIPVGTFVAFEDLPFPGSDFNYNDEDFVFTDVGTTTRTVPDSASSLTLLSMACTGVALLRRRFSA